MRHGHYVIKLFVFPCLAAIISVTPGCRRSPEEPVPPPTPTTMVETETPELNALELPQTNPEIGITVE